MEFELDPGDGLPLNKPVGKWALEKHERLHKYVDITRAVRRKYTVKTSENEYKGGATYIDLFCGAARSRLRGTNKIIDGSPLVAHLAALGGKYPFTEIHLADENERLCAAAVTRVLATGGKVEGHVDSAENVAGALAAKLNPYGLHFAFLDPFNLEGLTFETIRRLSKLRHIDMLVHVSVLDLQRNLARYLAQKISALDTFAPDWRSNVDLQQSKRLVRKSIVEYWGHKLNELGFSFRGVDLVTGSKNQRLYWLVFLSREPKANDLWDKIRYVSGQRDLLSGL